MKKVLFTLIGLFLIIISCDRQDLIEEAAVEEEELPKEIGDRIEDPSYNRIGKQRLSYVPYIDAAELKVLLREYIERDAEIWVFPMAGQSNMAGRDTPEAQDSIIHPRILTINDTAAYEFVQGPSHFYEPNSAGLDCGLSFGNRLLEALPPHITVLLVPTAVGGTSISQWLNDETARGVALLSNFRYQVDLAMEFGELKGILWHQGESDANPEGIATYDSSLTALFSDFRDYLGNEELPIVMGELSSFSRNNENYQEINSIIHSYSEVDSNTRVVYTQDLEHKGDRIHFNAHSTRLMGERYAEKMLELFGFRIIP